jgi:Fe-S cluster assembly protein SufD
MAHLVEHESPAAAQKARYMADYQRASQDSSAPAWLRQTRQQAIAQFERLGFPTTRLEEWKFTSVTPIAERAFALSEDGASGVSLVDVTRFALGGPTAAVIVCVNGHYAPQLSSTGTLPDGVRVTGLASALAANPDVLEPHLTRFAPTEHDAFTALNTAFLRDGAFILLPSHAVIETPVHVLFISTTLDGAPTVSHPRLLVVAGDDSQAQIVEEYVAPAQDGGAASFTNAVTEVVLGANANVDYCRLQHNGAEAFHIGTTYVAGGRSSSFSSHSLNLGGALVRHEVVAVLDGEGVDCTLDGFYLVGDRQLVDNHTTIDHARAHCTSREVYRGILAGRARAVFNGKIIVRPDAQKTDARQTNKALLLSDDAQINTKPQLEIFANDVKCTHGAAVGQLDEDALFYLRTRGLGVDEARRLLIHAFAGDIVNRLRIASLRERLQAAIAAQVSGNAVHS